MQDVRAALKKMAATHSTPDAGRTGGGIARLAGHASSRTTEVIYRRELRPVITTGAEVMDQIFRPKQLRERAATATG